MNNNSNDIRSENTNTHTARNSVSIISITIVFLFILIYFVFPDYSYARDDLVIQACDKCADLRLNSLYGDNHRITGKDIHRDPGFIVKGTIKEIDYIVKILSEDSYTTITVYGDEYSEMFLKGK